MDTSNRRLVSLVIGVLRVIRADGALPRVLDEVDQIDDHFLEFQESVPSVGRPGERVPLINRPAAGSPRYEIGRMSPSVSTKIDALSPRQCDVLNLIAEGQSNKEIARILDITPERRRNADQRKGRCSEGSEKQLRRTEKWCVEQPKW